MDFVSNQQPQIEAMLREIGVKDVMDLFNVIPQQLILPKPVNEDGMAEQEGFELMQALSKKNQYASYDSYLGAGAYEHYIPAIVDAICSKSEFLTAYTPYQAEASQGMLQAIYEYQSAICALTGMDVANASLYDGASACAEALLMAMRLKKGRSEILISQMLNPFYQKVIHQYLQGHAVTIKSIPHDTTSWQMDSKTLNELVNEDTIAVLLQSPNFLGIMENVSKIRSKVKSKEALLILVANPLSYGIYASAGELGVDIAVGDSQPFGLPLEFGGPYAGYLACRQEFIRQMPGRYVGETFDTQGKGGYVLTLQAREQHIRREKATSNICTNQALAALASLISISWYGKKGVEKLAATNFARSSYLKESLAKIPSVRFLSNASIFNEFAISFGASCHVVQSHFRQNKIEPGWHLGSFNPSFKDYFLVAVTETKSQQQLDRYVQLAQTLKER